MRQNERERERERELRSNMEREKILRSVAWGNKDMLCVRETKNVCVCVCEREKEREKEGEGECVSHSGYIKAEGSVIFLLFKTWDRFVLTIRPIHKKQNGQEGKFTS